MSNLALCYTKIEKYQESIDLDLKIFAQDNKYDKSYLRLYDNYLKLGKKEQAAFFGNSLLKFDEETLKKYENYDKIKADIENLNKTLLDELNAKKAKEKKEMMKKIGKYAIPVVILIAAVAIYFFVFKKKQITK